MNNEHEILKDLLVDESDIIKNLSLVIQKVKDIFVIEKESGKIIFKEYSKLTNPQKIFCILMGKFFAKRLGIIDDITATISEISSELDIPQTTLSSPLKSLRKSGQILYDKSRYRINPHRIEEIINSNFSKSNNTSSHYKIKKKSKKKRNLN